jgi:hypothetical protein
MFSDDSRRKSKKRIGTQEVSSLSFEPFLNPTLDPKFDSFPFPSSLEGSLRKQAHHSFLIDTSSLPPNAIITDDYSEENSSNS